MPEELVGKVTDFFARPVVAGIELSATLNVEQAKAGDLVGIKVSDRVRGGDTIHKVTD